MLEMKFRWISRGLFFLSMTVHLGCALEHAVSPIPLAPAQVAANIGVIIEDHLEDPECDRQETTILEAASDVLNTPATLLSVSVAYSVGLGWTIADFCAQTYEILWKGMLEPETKLDPEKRFAQVRQWIPFGYAEPDPFGQKPAPCPQIVARRN